MFENKVAVVTGGAKGIGKAIAGEFRKAGANVCVIDLLPNAYYQGDLADQRSWRILPVKCWMTMAMWTISSTTPCR